MVLVLTQTGKAARLVSKYRPACPIIAITQVRSVIIQSLLLLALDCSYLLILALPCSYHCHYNHRHCSERVGGASNGGADVRG